MKYFILIDDNSKIDYSNSNRIIYNRTSKKISYQSKKGLLYTVGLMSDVHYNDTCQDHSEHIDNAYDNAYNPYEDLENVLKYYNTNNVNFIACAGDISTDSIQHVEAFNRRVTELTPNIPVYTCKGNHDNKASYDKNTEWLQYTMPSNSLYNIIYFTSGDKTSFYYTTPNDDVYIYLNLDYNDNSNTSTKVLEDNVSSQYYNPQVLEEFQNILDINRNKRCFIFTHLFFPNKTGNINYDYTINRSHNYWLSGYQFALLNEMNNYYKNTIWFSGHSHYQWLWEKDSARVNICNWDILNDNYNYNDYANFARNINNAYDENLHTDVIKTAWNVHLPSTCRPLKPHITDYSKAIADPGAEGAIMEVYENHVNIVPLVFADENSKIINTQTKQINAADFIIDISKSGYDAGQKVEQDGDYVKITFTKQSQRFYIQNCIGNNIKIDELIILNRIDNEITDSITSMENPKIGFFDGVQYVLKTDKLFKGYYSKLGFSQENQNPNSLGGIEFPCSSSFIGVFPITIKIKCSSLSDDIVYDNKCFKLNPYNLLVGGKNNVQIETKEYSYFTEKIQQFNK